ncbi:sugar ABC transporter permease [Pseudarthrobacter sp. J75]|uniref:carbohydrate ABC transporter permease n=1 Tax=unclassified Pseudarthrobacter TaxID=2647000 RepID=UPI002E816BF9|nr:MULTISPECIES: sugar ABC transporter permease [unclassified Pseudarthrobacter]MEE2523144.1 sugar ABC transporter permease [Pseudarthrobacter sp. J47]MEE2529828.1 sugar ABC transporter permease [Pseudarthrobacter sp. J75]MEE2569145.1 sugar ABC transporter permease [Pseudarthrobacter sp. J64]
MFLAPFFVLFLAFTIAPIGYSGFLSLFTEKSSGLGLGGATRVFNGLENYARAVQDPSFLVGFLNIAIYCLFYIPVMIGLSLVVALLLDSTAARAKGFFRLAFYMPNIVPGLIAAVIWVYLYTPGVSPLVDIFESTGSTWDLGSHIAALLSLSNITIWLHTGYNVILFYAALQAVPREVLEAATVDGAGPIRTAFAIKARMIMGAVSVATLFTVVGAMQLFAEPLLLKSRATSIDSNWTPNMFIYQTAFEKHDFGYAAATALLFAVFIGALSWAVTKFGSKVDS